MKFFIATFATLIVFVEYWENKGGVFSNPAVIPLTP